MASLFPWVASAGTTAISFSGGPWTLQSFTKDKEVLVANTTYWDKTRIPKIQQGGILDIAMPLDAAKVMLVCPKCSRPTRIGHTVLEDGRRIRVCSHCGQALEVTT